MAEDAEPVMRPVARPLVRPVVRPKEPADAAACIAGLAETHAADRYPMVWPDDPAGWLQPTSTLAAWVAAAGDTEATIAGHVVLRHAIGHVDAPAFAAATGLAEADHGLIARLWVTPTWQGRGLGRRLLGAAVDEARHRGLHPVLDVMAESTAAIALYESLGWTNVGSRPFTFSDGTVWPMHYYVAPTG
jgi:GNAT superfamily N-acetyltransferase